MTARRVLVLAALAWAVGAGLLFVLGPVYSSRGEALVVASFSIGMLYLPSAVALAVAAALPARGRCG